MKIRIDRAEFERVVKAALAVELPKAGDRMGAMIVSHARRRFDDAGDETERWPDLWASNSDAVAHVTKKSTAGESERQRQKTLAEKNVKRVEAQIAKGTISASKAAARRRRAKDRVKRARSIARAGTTDLFRAGGEPMRDTGAARASFTHRVRSESALKVIVEIGSPLDYTAYHQTGFGPTAGPNYIPLTQRARKGWSENLIPGYDYVVLASVTVPRRTMLRITDRNRDEIRQSFAGTLTARD